MDFTVFILAGGNSSRMGQNKAFLKIGGQNEITRLVDLFKKITNNIVIVTNDFEAYKSLNLPLVEDIRKGFGPLAGIEAALNYTKTENNLVVACDMPFIDTKTCLQILSQLEGYDAVVPLIEGTRHPLFAAYRKSVLPLLSETLDNKDRKILFFLNKIRVNYIKEEDFPELDGTSFFNMNNPEEYEEAKRIYNSLAQNPSNS